MSAGLENWSAEISVSLPSEHAAEWLGRALGPEATREVPRTRAEVARSGPTALTVRLWARDTGALRAGLNTYLGWIHLGLATLRRAAASGIAGGPGSP